MDVCFSYNLSSQVLPKQLVKACNLGCYNKSGLQTPHAARVVPLLNLKVLHGKRVTLHEL